MLPNLRDEDEDDNALRPARRAKAEEKPTKEKLSVLIRKAQAKVDTGIERRQQKGALA